MRRTAPALFLVSALSTRYHREAMYAPYEAACVVGGSTQEKENTVFVQYGTEYRLLLLGATLFARDVVLQI